MTKVKKSTRKSTRTHNFDFDIYCRIATGQYPTQIAKELNFSKQRVDYYISSLKQRDLITMRGKGVWETLQNYRPRKSKKSSRVAKHLSHKDFDYEKLDADTIRGHAFQIKLKLPKNLRNWYKRREILEKLNIRYKELSHLFGGGQRISFRGKKIHLTNSSIIIYDRDSYFAETSMRSHSMAIIKNLYVIKALERKLRGVFSTNGKYAIKVTKQHHALVKNALAQIYNKPKRQKLEVYYGKGLWLLIDNSWNLDELECVSSETAVQDADKVKEFFNSLKEAPIKTTEIKANFEEVRGMLKESSEVSIQLGQVMKQIEGNLIHLTKIVMKGGDKKNAD